MRNIFNDGVEVSTRKSQARFQIIQVSSSAEPRMRLGKSENLPEISLSRPDPIIDSLNLHLCSEYKVSYTAQLTCTFCYRICQNRVSY